METDPATRDLILDAAEALFAGQGFGSTSIKEIGARAGANPALIYYYFGSKDTLYREVLRRLFSLLITAATERLDAAPPPPDAAVRMLIGLQAERLKARPTLPRLLAREMIDPHAEHAEEHVGQLAGQIFARVCKLIEQGQAAGVFRRDLDARFCALSAVSLVPYTHIARPAIGVLLGRGAGQTTDDDMDAYARHAAEFVISALQARRGCDADREAAR